MCARRFYSIQPMKTNTLSFTLPRKVAEHFGIRGELRATNSIMPELYTHTELGERLMFYSNQTDNVCYCVGTRNMYFWRNRVRCRGLTRTG